MRGRWLVVLLALLAAAAFALSVQGGSWWTLGDITVGPFGSKQCFADECRKAFVGGTFRWLRTGIGTWAAGLLAMFVLTILAAGVASKRVPKLAAKTALVSIITALAAGVLFIVQFPGMPGSALGRGIPLFVAAIVVGIATCVTVLRAQVQTVSDTVSKR